MEKKRTRLILLFFLLVIGVFFHPFSHIFTSSIRTEAQTPTQIIAPSCVGKLYGDANGDRRVDMIDFEILRKEEKTIRELTTTTADFNGNGAVEMDNAGLNGPSDFDIWFQNFSNNVLIPTCIPPTLTPIPTASPTPLPCATLGQSCANKSCCSGYWCNAAQTCAIPPPPTATASPCANLGESCATKACCSSYWCNAIQTCAIPVSTPTSTVLPSPTLTSVPFTPTPTITPTPTTAKNLTPKPIITSVEGGCGWCGSSCTVITPKTGMCPDVMPPVGSVCTTVTNPDGSVSCVIEGGGAAL